MAFDWDSFSDKFSIFGEGFGRWLKGAFGSQNERVVRSLIPVVAQVNELEGWAKGLSAEHFKAVAQVIGYVFRLQGKIKAN